MMRNNRDRSNTQKQHYYKHDDIKEVICEQILDQIHSYIFHTFDVGFNLTFNKKRN